MYLDDLELQNFRNYGFLKLNFCPQVNIFFGQNAQGKTNLLEAISLLSFGKSFRTKKEVELIKWANEACYLRGRFQNDELITQIELGIGTKEKRAKLDGQIVKSAAVFGKIPVITFAPDDLQLIKGGPQYRRDFIDLYLALIEPKYRFIYYNFYKVLQQRNRLLKSTTFNSKEFEAWNDQLIEKGTKVIKYRSVLLESVKPFVAQAQYQISGTLEKLDMEYLCLQGENVNDKSEDEIKKEFSEELVAVKKQEIERRVTLVGPHRDDLRLTIDNGVELRNFGSQGQQRTAALALKLGLIEKIKEVRGHYPILLLDDVMSEFDDDRKRFLLTVLISSAQTFMTSTGKRDFPMVEGESLFFKVERGEVNRVE